MIALSSRVVSVCALLAAAGALVPMVALAQSAPTSTPQAASAKSDTFDLARVQAAADAEANWIIKRGAAPGVCIGVARGGQVLFAKGYGKADLENDVTVTPESVFRIASITKQFTAAAIMKLVEQGKVKLDEPVKTYIPEFQESAASATVRHLLTHTSGLPDFTDLREAREAVGARVDVTYRDIVTLFEKLPLLFQPGEKHEYCNTGYLVLGEIIARVSGMTYPEYLDRELLALGLQHTGYADPRRVVPKRVRGYFDENGKFFNPRYMSPDVAGGAGAVQSTVLDLIKWTHLLHTGKVVSMDSLRAMATPVKLNDGTTAPYGFGLQLFSRLDRTTISHGGNGNGFSAFLAHWPTDDLTVVVLANGRAVLPNLAGEAVARVALGIEQPAIKVAADLAKYEGTYTLTLGERTFDLRVYAEDGNLIGHRTGNRPFRLVPVGEHRFQHDQDSDTEFRFTLEDGKRAAITLVNPRGEFPGKRKP
jgi:D-alanyl-D-alanine carboxypeptidase